MKTDAVAKACGPSTARSARTRDKGEAPGCDLASRKAGAKKPGARRPKAIDERQLTFFDLF